MTTKKNETSERKPPDKSPENDITKASDLLRSARAKFIRHGKEDEGSAVLEVLMKLGAIVEKL